MTIRIGNGAGFWGDNLDAPRLLAESGQLDYLTLEYLAELTLSILAHLKSRDPAAGYVSDFVTVAESLVPVLRDQPALKIVTNGGGMNPAGCAAAVSQILVKAGLGHLRVAAATGDDVLSDLDRLMVDGESFAHLDTGAPFTDIRARLASANAYLGAAGIVAALADGAQIVITGRVADASLTVGPAMHEFGWTADDWQRLGAATAAGHLIECGAQATGGMFSGWSRELDLENVGYPIAELSEDGGVVITKPENMGGAVTTHTVAEQLVYEIGDPAHYLTPDVDADFSQITLTQDGPDRVRVENAAGNAAPDRYKVSIAYRDGYMAAGTLVVYGPQATEKARACAEMILSRLKRAGCEPARTNVECLGAGDCVPGVTAQADPPEVVLRVTAHDPSRDVLDRFVREFAPLVTSGPAGVTGYTGPRPKPYPVMGFWPTTVARDAVSSKVAVRTAGEWIA